MTKNLQPPLADGILKNQSLRFFFFLFMLFFLGLQRGSATCTAPPTLPNATYLGAYNNSYYYKVTTSDVTCPEAAALCFAHGGRLPKITSSAHNTWLKGLVGGKFWCGLGDNLSEGNWKYHDGSTGSYTNWGWGSPSTWYSGSNDYCYVATDGSWKDCDGSTKAWVVIEVPCTEVNPAPVCSGTPPTIPNATYIGTFDDAFYYKVTSSGNSTCHEAAAKCLLYGGRLPKIESSAHNTWLKTQGNCVFWHSLSDVTSVGNWKHCDGSIPSYTNWSSGVPSSTKHFGRCNTNGTWNDSDNTGTAWTIIEVPCTPTAPPPPPPITCPAPPTLPNAMYLGSYGNSYYYKITTGDVTCSQAAAYCFAHGGRLPKILSSDHNNWLKNLVNGKFFIGYGDDAVEGSWKYHDGSSAPYKNWGFSCPSGWWSSNNDYTYVDTDGKWRDCDSNDKAWTIIEIPCNVTVPVPCNAAAPTIPNTMYLGIYDNAHYYKITTGDVTCHQAEALCLTNGGRLPRIKSSAHNTWLKNLVGGDCWLGLSDALSEGNWKYQNGALPAYFNWKSGEPNNYGGSEHYARCYGDGTWNDDNCNAKAWCIIEIPIQTYTPGTACNDGNPNTSNDVYQADGCTCAGTSCNLAATFTVQSGCLTASYLIFADANDPYSPPNNPKYTYSYDIQPSNTVAGLSSIDPRSVTATFNAPGVKTVTVTITNPAVPNCQLVKTTTFTVTDCSPCANLGGDTDGDGICNNNDCQPNNPAFPATPGTPCNDGNANTTNDVVTANGCGCAGTPVTPVCDNITNGGTIGFGTNCLASTSIPCNTAAPSITNCVSPSGGTGAFETVWLKSNTSCSAPTTSAAQIMAGQDPHWVFIPGETGLTLSPGTVSANTCYLRCTRRAGCGVFLESNIISLTTDCVNNTPDCINGITITTGNGTISVTGLDGAPVSSLQILTSTWQQQYSCFANCGASQTVNVPAGTYYVYAKYYNAGYALLCEKQATVTVTGGTSPCANQGGDSDGDGVCNNQDCQPNNPAFPATPGSACNDGNANTTNDVVTADGCGCAGTPVTNGPDCNANISITTGNGSITVTGLGAAPVSSLQILTSTWQQQYSCFANCGASQTVNVPAGTYFVYAKYYNAGYSLLCEKQATVTVTGGSPCANLGGDTDGDGVCNNNDCQPNNPAYPATPGSACNDGNANTTNDVVTTDGCGCAGTPVNNNNCVVGTQRSVANTYDNCGTWCGGNYVLTFGANNCYTAGTDLVFKEFANGTATLTGTVKKGTSTLNVNLTFTGKTTSAPANSPHYDLCTTSGGSSWYYYPSFSGTIGSYTISKYGPAFQIGNGANLQDNTYGASGWFNYGGSTNGDMNFKLLAASNITGPDSDNDGVCDANDCQPNNAAYPAAPGSACNDGNANTTNDVIQADGCTCAGSTNNGGGGYCKIGHKVWHDKNNDGIFNGTDSGISGCWVNLKDHLGNSLGWKMTDNNGYFNFDNLQPGNYKLCFSTPGGFIPTSKHAGNDDTNDSDIDYWSGHSDLFSLIGGQIFDHCDAGYKSGQYLIGQGQDFTFEVNKQLEFANIFWRHNGGSFVNTYKLERSADGINFEEISAFDSRGGSADEFYEDYDVEPLVGDNYYRLAIHRVDGNIAYSEVKKVVFEDLVDYQLFPNPANSFVSVNLETVIGKQAEIVVFNNLGLRVKAFQLDEIYSKYYQMDLRDVKEGHYVVWINVAGRRPVAKTLMIGRL